VLFARRPGTFAAVFEPATGLVVRRFDTPPDRHLYGHGVFDPTGRILFATEAASGLGLVVEIDPVSGALDPLGPRAPVAYDNRLPCFDAS
jgi:hypothetical protein